VRGSSNSGIGIIEPLRSTWSVGGRVEIADVTQMASTGHGIEFRGSRDSSLDVLDLVSVTETCGSTNTDFGLTMHNNTDNSVVAIGSTADVSLEVIGVRQHALAIFDNDGDNWRFLALSDDHHVRGRVGRVRQRHLYRRQPRPRSDALCHRH
jgi:hypothetical protein